MSKEGTYLTPKLWRLNLKSQAIDRVNPQDFAIDHEIAGVGWRVEGKVTGDPNSYWSLGMEQYKGKGLKGWKTAANAFLYRMEIGDLIWTRNAQGMYFLGQITGPWKYKSDKEYMDADLVNIRPCNWMKIGLQDAVPGKVLASFRGSSAVQQVHDDIACKYSQLKYNELTETKNYQPIFDTKGKGFLKSCLSDQDWEDLAGLYLQVERGYFLIPSSCKKDTAVFEFILRHKEDGAKAVVQVKTGKDELKPEFYVEIAKTSKVYLLDLVAEKDDALGLPQVERLLAEELDAFARKYVFLMPDGIRFWLDIEEKITKGQTL